MCDTIIMPDGKEVETISQENGEDVCLCWNTQREVLHWIIDDLPDVGAEIGLAKNTPLIFGDKFIIERTPFGYTVSIKKEKKKRKNHG